MDVVYLLKDSPTNEEFIYSLRSLKNLPHDRVFIVGGCPNNINMEKVFYIPLRQGGSKYKNTTQNLITACQDARLSQEFILMNDDFFILKKIENTTEELNLCRGTISAVLEGYEKRYGKDANNYIKGMRQTMIFLQDCGIKEPLSYELHIPFIMDKDKFLEIFSLPHVSSVNVLHKRSVYGNLYHKNSTYCEDVKFFANIYVPIHNDKFLSTEDNSFALVKPYLSNLFSSKSEYEI